MDAETRAVIERLVEVSIDSAFKWSATEEESAKLESAIAEARKLLEDDALSKPASEDAWLVEAEQLVRGAIKYAEKDGNSNYLTQLRAHLRTRPAREGFVSVPVEPTEAMQKNDERYRWLRSRIPGSAYRVAGVIYSEGGAGVDSAIDAAMLLQQKGDTNADV